MKNLPRAKNDFQCHTHENYVLTCTVKLDYNEQLGTGRIGSL